MVGYANVGGPFVFVGGTQLPSGVATVSLVDVIGNVQAFKATNSLQLCPRIARSQRVASVPVVSTPASIAVLALL
jgi:hypothetical protein